MTLGDIDEVVAIEESTFSTPWSEGTFRTLLERSGVESWVLDGPDVGLVAYAIAWCILDQGELANIAVASHHRGRGYGSFLLTKILAVARGRGVESMYLEVRSSNTAAAQLYRRFGFEEVGIRKGYYESPIEDALVMAARLL
jgi:ribosomal-protein-alanine N-acetyltransferase